MLLAGVISSATYWTASYQILRLTFVWLGDDKSDLSDRLYLIAIGFVLIMAWMARLPRRLAIVLLQANKVSIADFEPWRVQLEKTRWTVIAALVALPTIPLMLRPVWTGDSLLFVLPFVVLIHLRGLLVLPAPTDPSNRLDVDQPLQ